MQGIKTNRLGKIIVLMGIAAFILSFILGLQHKSSLLDKGPLIGYGCGIAAILLGLYIRLVGEFLNVIGMIIVILAILHAVLFHLAKFAWLSFGLDRRLSIGIGGLEFLLALAGVVLIICGYFFSRTEEEEELASARRSAQLRSPQIPREINAGEIDRTRSSCTSNDPRCPNCNARAAGNLFVGNRIMDCLTCGGVFCGNCAKGFLDRACPHCGETSQKRVKFRDTGTNW